MTVYCVSYDLNKAGQNYDALYEELEAALLMADAGVGATEYLLEELKKRVYELETFLLKAKLEVDNRLVRKSAAYYYHVKELAEAGDAEARKVYEDLRPSFEAYLRSSIELN